MLITKKWETFLKEKSFADAKRLWLPGLPYKKHGQFELPTFIFLSSWAQWGSEPRCFKCYSSLLIPLLSWGGICTSISEVIFYTKKGFRSETSIWSFNSKATCCSLKDTIPVLPQSCCIIVRSFQLAILRFWRDAKVATTDKLCCEGHSIRWGKGEKEVGILVCKQRLQAQSKRTIVFVSNDKVFWNPTQKSIIFSFFLKETQLGQNLMILFTSSPHFSGESLTLVCLYKAEKKL